MEYQRMIMEMEVFEKFTSREAASFLGIPAKEATNGLVRLREMGFLARIRVPRECFSRSGLICHRGFENVYSWKRQGRQYVRWLRDARARLMREIVDCLPTDLKERILDHFQTGKTYRYKGPARKSALLDGSTACLAILRSGN